MSKTSLILALSVMALSSVPAWATQATSYKGVWGEQQIIVELTDVADGPVVGRYSLLVNGTDVPLRALKQSATALELAEEVPCTPQICDRDDDGDYAKAPLGAHWHLSFSADHKSLYGTVGADANSPGMPVSLQEIGTRPYERYDTFTYSFFVWKNYSGDPITPQTTPYDYAKMQVPLTEGPVMQMGGGSYRSVIDPRTKFEFPRVVTLPGGGDITPINRALDEQRWSTNWDGFDCLATNYLSAGWDGSLVDDGYSTLGDIDQESIMVDSVSSRIMSIVQSGSTYCGGGSPYNHANYSTFDVLTGKPLDLSQIFTGWLPTKDGVVVPLTEARAKPADYQWGPDAALVKFVREHRLKSPDYDAAYDADCEIDQNIGEHLNVSFSDGDLVVFLIDGIDQAACSGEILVLPLAEVAPLLTPNAGTFFGK